jgi:hypothetical protein
MLIPSIPMGEAGAKSVLAVTLVDMQGLPITSLGGGGGGSSTQYVVATYHSDILANTCVRLETSVAWAVTSRDVAAPWVDGIALQAGLAGSSNIIACLPQITYTSTGALPEARMLFLGQDGHLTEVPPSHSNGDLWSVTVARRTGPNQFLFDPQIPIALI